MYKLIQLFTALLIILALPAYAEVKGEITEYGYYKMTADPKRYRNLASTSGYVQEGGQPVLVEKTDKIPLELKRLFGFKFRISGFDDKRSVQLKLVVSHPRITRPNGSTSTGYTYPLVFDVEDGLIENESGYSLDHEFELVEGEWKFEYWYYRQKLVSQTFNTYKKEGTVKAESTDMGSLEENTNQEQPQPEQSQNTQSESEDNS